MKKLALGIATAAVLFTAVPAMAFGVHVGVGPVGVGVGAGPYYGYGSNCGYWNNCGGGYYDYYGGPYDGGGVAIGAGGLHGHAHFRHR